MSEDCIPDRRSLRLELPSASAPGVEDAGKDGTQPGAAVLPIRRKVGPAVEDLTLGRKERRQRPTALSGQRLNGSLIPGIHVWSFIAVYLDADEVPVEEFGDGRILV